MKRFLMAGAAGALLAAAAMPAQAEPDGWYVAGDFGYNWKEDWGVFSENDAPDGSPYNFNVSTEDDWAAFARLGYRLNDNWRTELEGGYRPGDVDSAIGFARVAPTSVALCTPGVIRTATTPCGGPEGDFNQWSLMGNLIYDFGNDDWVLRPYLGIGAGVNRVSADFVGQFSTSPTGAATPAELAVNDDDYAFAWQVLAGFGWALSERLTLEMNARWMNTDEVSLDTTSSTTAVGWQPGALEGEFENATVSIGLRWSLGEEAAPPPPPPPPLPPAPTPRPTTPPPTPPVPPVVQPREFTVYFDWDRSDLTTEAAAIVRQAADYARSGGQARINVVGHTDTSGSAAYNVRLSQRRAATVRDALVAAGVNGAAITTDARGETELARPTADGVRDPLNRRAVIGINFNR